MKNFVNNRYYCFKCTSFLLFISEVNRRKEVPSKEEKHRTERITTSAFGWILNWCCRLKPARFIAHYCSKAARSRHKAYILIVLAKAAQQDSAKPNINKCPLGHSGYHFYRVFSFFFFGTFFFVLLHRNQKDKEESTYIQI